MIAVETASPTQVLHLLTDWAVRQGLELGGLTVNPPSLEDIYLRLTSDAVTGERAGKDNEMTTAVTAARARGGAGPQASCGHQVGYEQLSFWRNPQSAIFTFLFPVVFLIVIGALFSGAGRSSYFDGLSALQYYVPTIAVRVGVRLVLRPARGRARGAAAERDPEAAPGYTATGVGVLRRPGGALHPGQRHRHRTDRRHRAALGVPLPSDWPQIVATLVLGAICFCALGVAVASVIANADAAPAVAQLILFPLLFISGTYTPIHSAALNRIAGCSRCGPSTRL